MDQPCKVANPACGQLIRENECFSVPVRAEEFGLARQVRPSRPASSSLLILHTQAESGAYSWDCSRFSRRRPFINLHRQPPSGQSRVYQATQLRADAVHCRETAGTVSIAHKVDPETGAAFSGITMDQLMCTSLFPTPTIGTQWTCVCRIR